MIKNFKVFILESSKNLENLILKTDNYIKKNNIEDRYIYSDREFQLVSTKRSVKTLKQILGKPILNEFVFEKTNFKSSDFIDYLEDNTLGKESNKSVLKRLLTSLPKKKVSLNKIKIVQKFIFEIPLQKYMKNKEYKKNDLYILKYNNQYILNDNNHRVAAAKLNDENSLDFVILEIN